MCIYAHVCFLPVEVTVGGGVCGKVCCIAAVVEYSVFLALECCKFV